MDCGTGNSLERVWSELSRFALLGTEGSVGAERFRNCNEIKDLG